MSSKKEHVEESTFPLTLVETSACGWKKYILTIALNLAKVHFFLHDFNSVIFIKENLKNLKKTSQALEGKITPSPTFFNLKKIVLCASVFIFCLFLH